MVRALYQCMGSYSGGSMKTFHITCEEITTFIVEVEAENEEQAFELVNENVNGYEVINESVSEWCIDDVQEVA